MNMNIERKRKGNNRYSLRGFFAVAAMAVTTGRPGKVLQGNFIFTVKEVNHVSHR